ncbi:hypothetical protein KAU09_03870 [Candidatus Parcubacteria bacterium]|nr:hypothetical protein [Candidatus Parcubacteria bacterium]
MRGIMIALEGLDFVGKTTIAKMIGLKNGWVYYKTPPKIFFSRYTKLTAKGTPSFSEKKFLLFIESLEYASEEIHKLLEDGISVAVDRWIWTTLSYHFAFNDKLRKKWIEGWRHLISDKMVEPNKSFLIHISNEDVRLNRIIGRKITPHDKKVMNNKKRRDLIFQLYKKLNPNFIDIDNLGSPESTIGKIWTNI